MHALGDGAGNRHGGRGVTLEGKEGLTDGDLDLMLAPRDDLIIAADHTERGGGGGIAVDRNLACTVEEEALGDEIGVVVDEGLLDELIEGVQREADGRLGAGEPGEIAGDLAADAGDPGAVGLGKDVFLAASEVHIGESLAEGVRDLGEHETLLTVRAEKDDVRDFDPLGGKQVAPSVVRFLLDGSVDGAL